MMKLVSSPAPSLLPLVVCLGLGLPLAGQAVATVHERILDEGLRNSQVMRFQDVLCNRIGGRLTGSTSFRKACDWALAEFQGMGLSARLEPWDTWNMTWDRGQWAGRVMEPESFELQVATPAWTAPTRGQVTGRLVRMPEVVEDVEQLLPVLGEVYLWGKRPRRGSETHDALNAAVAKTPPLGFVQSARSNGMADRRFANQMRVFGNHITAKGSFDRIPTVPEIVVRDDQAERIDALLEGNKEVLVRFDIRNRFVPGELEVHNVVADLVGTDHPDEVVIVCGHLDSWHQATGATDNGTGTCSTLEAARILTAAGAKPKRTIRFILWGGEEQGLLGSAAYVRRHRQEMQKVSAVFNHDSGTNWAYSLTVTNAMHPLMAAALAPVMGMTSPQQDWDGRVFKLNKTKKMSGGFGGSDHASFLSAGVPAWSWGLKGESQYGYGWHSQWDTYDIVIPAYQAHTSTVAAIAALGVADLETLLPREGIERRSGSGSSDRMLTFLRKRFGVEVSDEVVIEKLIDGGPAQRAGLKKGDKIVAVWGESVKEVVDLYRGWRKHIDDEVLAFTVRRGDQKVEGKAKVEEEEGGER